MEWISEMAVAFSMRSRESSDVRRVGRTAEDASEARWMEAFSRGDASGATPLYQRHGERMKSVARNLMGNEPDAEDAVQEAFLKAYRSARDFRGGSKVSTWLYRLLVNTCYDSLRKRRRRGELQTLEDAAEAQSMAVPAEDHASRLALERSLARIGERRRTAFLLFAVEGFTHGEIGEILEVSESGSKSLVFEARKQLQRLRVEGPDEKETP